MNKDIFNKLTGLPQTTSTNMHYYSVNFVDDSTNIISTTNGPEMQDYINKFYSLLEAVYNTNKLIINNDKTKLMIICKNCFQMITKHIQINASGYKVNQVSKVKILGYIMQSNLHKDKQIAKTISNINNHLYNIKKL